jgi:hypothetical protein
MCMKRVHIEEVMSLHTLKVENWWMDFDKI